MSQENYKKIMEAYGIETEDSETHNSGRTNWEIYNALDNPTETVDYKDLTETIKATPGEALKGLAGLVKGTARVGFEAGKLGVKVGKGYYNLMKAGVIGIADLTEAGKYIGKALDDRKKTDEDRIKNFEKEFTKKGRKMPMEFYAQRIMAKEAQEEKDEAKAMAKEQWEFQKEATLRNMDAQDRATEANMMAADAQRFSTVSHNFEYRSGKDRENFDNLGEYWAYTKAKMREVYKEEAKAANAGAS